MLWSSEVSTTVAFGGIFGDFQKTAVSFSSECEKVPSISASSLSFPQIQITDCQSLTRLLEA